MTSDISDDTVLRGVNALIAENYDRVPYDQPASPGLDPEHVFALAAKYGPVRNHRAADVLDLGCGTGTQLERVGDLTSGRLVGTDLSQAAYIKAVTRTARFASRCKIHHADFIDLDADALGQFDLIYNIGVIYVTPPAVQRHLLDLIARCLKPGGLAVISYYAGTVPLLMAGLHKVLRAGTDLSESPQDQVRTARSHIHVIANTISRQQGDHRLMAGVLQQVHGTPDTIFFHEMLNQSFGTLTTSALEFALGLQGVHFLNWMQPAPFEPDASPRARAMMADAYSFAGGGYFYGVFRKDD